MTNGVGDAGLQVPSERCSIPAQLLGTTASLGRDMAASPRLLAAPGVLGCSPWMARVLSHATWGWHGNRERTSPAGHQVGPMGRGDHGRHLPWPGAPSPQLCLMLLSSSLTCSR